MSDISSFSLDIFIKEKEGQMGAMKKLWQEQVEKEAEIEASVSIGTHFPPIIEDDYSTDQLEVLNEMSNEAEVETVNQLDEMAEEALINHLAEMDEAQRMYEGA